MSETTPQTHQDQSGSIGSLGAFLEQGRTESDYFRAVGEQRLQIARECAALAASGVELSPMQQSAAATML